MKRRNAECGKIRRPVKRTKIVEGIYGSTFLYVKFLVVWALVLLADFILEFRFEYLWPFWLLLRSVYDSFKYQGLAFSVFFVFIAFTSDMICFLFIPVHWLFFAASTYVWVQYVWHTERGICLPTISLWLLFVYIEASVRLKELKNLPFHLDLCRPFAAHCIGYPVVTLGFGFKSYVGYRMRLRKQKEVAKENNFYNDLLQQALPAEAPSIAANTCSQDKDKGPKSPPPPPEEAISNGHCITANHGHGRKSICNSNHNSITTTTTTTLPANSAENSVKSAPYSELDTRKHNHTADYQYMESVNVDFEESDESCERESKKSNGVAGCHATAGSQQGRGKWSVKDNLNKRSRNAAKEVATSNFSAQKDDHTYRKKVINYRKNYVFRNCITASHICNSNHNSITTTTTTTLPANSAENSVKSAPYSELDTRNHNHTADYQYMESVNVDFEESDESCERESKKSNGVAGCHATAGSQQGRGKWSVKDNLNKRSRNAAKEVATSNFSAQKDDHTYRLEADIKRLKADLQSSRQSEQDLRSQVHSISVGERSVKGELLQLQQENESLQHKLQTLSVCRQQDKSTISSLEKRLQEERKLRTLCENQLATERKAKKADEAAAARALSLAAARTECTETCKVRRREMETEIKTLRRDMKLRDEKLQQMERQAQSLSSYQENIGSTQALVSALNAMEEKNARLENSLSAETRLKLDLFSALGEAKRQLEIAQSLLSQKDKEIDELKSKIAEVMAVMPVTSSPNCFSPPAITVSSLLYSPKYMEDKPPKSNLDPNASVYTPKVARINSAEGDM